MQRGCGTGSTGSTVHTTRKTLQSAQERASHLATATVGLKPVSLLCDGPLHEPETEDCRENLICLCDVTCQQERKFSCWHLLFLTTGVCTGGWSSSHVTRRRRRKSVPCKETGTGDWCHHGMVLVLSMLGACCHFGRDNGDRKLAARRGEVCP